MRSLRRQGQRLHGQAGQWQSGRGQLQAADGSRQGAVGRRHRQDPACRPVQAGQRPSLRNRPPRWAARNDVGRGCREAARFSPVLCGRSPHAVRPFASDPRRAGEAHCAMPAPVGAVRPDALHWSQPGNNKEYCHEFPHPMDGRHPEEHFRPDRTQSRRGCREERARDDGPGLHQDGPRHARGIRRAGRPAGAHPRPRRPAGGAGAATGRAPVGP